MGPQEMVSFSDSIRITLWVHWLRSLSLIHRSHCSYSAPYVGPQESVNFSDSIRIALWVQWLRSLSLSFIALTAATALPM